VPAKIKSSAKDSATTFAFEDKLWITADSRNAAEPSGARQTVRRAKVNFARAQHFVHHIARQGMAGFVLANGTMSSHQGNNFRRAHDSTRDTSCLS